MQAHDLIKDWVSDGDYNISLAKFGNPVRCLLLSTQDPVLFFVTLLFLPFISLCPSEKKCTRKQLTKSNKLFHGR